MRWTRAHPRLRREHYVPAAAACATAGSSPLARGTCVVPVAIACGERLIPARAGNTHPILRRTGRQRAHPRSRGEHAPWTAKSLSGRGSSPLARGTPGTTRHQAVVVRLIPARAGNTFKSTSCAHLPAAHPRSRGEHPRVSGRMIERSGSSPLARGTLHAGDSLAVGGRLIPARAGNTHTGRGGGLE